MTVTEDPPVAAAPPAAPSAVVAAPTPDEPNSKGTGRQGRRERDRGKDGAKALIDAFTMQQRRNARPRTDAAPPTRASPPTDAAATEPARTTASPPPRLPRGSRAAAQLDRVRGARAAAASTSPGPRGERARGASDGPGDRVFQDHRYDPEFDRGEGGQADERGAGRGRGGRGKPGGKLFDPETDFIPARRAAPEEEGGQRSLWPMPDAQPGPPPPHGHFPHHPHPPPPHFHPGFGPPPPHHHHHPPPHRSFGPPPFHPHHHGPPHRHGPPGHHGSPPLPPSLGGPPPHERPFLSPPGHPPHEPFPGHPRPHSPAHREPAPTTPINGSSTAGKQLYDPRRDDPVRFGSTKRSKAESASGSAVSKGKKKDKEGSSSGKSKSSKDSKEGANEIGPGKGDEASRQSDGSNSYVKKLKTAYKVIADLEKALKDEEAASRAREEELKQRDRDTGRLVPSGSGADTMRLVGQKRSAEDYWVRLSKQHQQLAEAHRHFLDMALDPRLPESLHSLPQKYNIPVRLWQTAFHQLLERLRHALPPTTASGTDSGKAIESNNLIEHMVDFIYYAYGFYTGLLSEPSFSAFRSAWIEQLGDLARYRMAVASLSAKYSAVKTGSSGPKMSRQSTSDDEEPADDDSMIAAGEGEEVGGRIDDEAKSRGGGSIGVAALNDWDYEEQETWRNTACDWYAKGLAETPAVGRLHHHLALLSKGDELKALYHYVKSLTAPHPYLPARESVLPFFEAEHQTRRTRSEVSLSELFVHLHGMLFTKIQLDDFDDELARFLELLAQERLLLSKLGASGHAATPESCWIMMAIVNIGALLQYGADDSVLGRAMAAPAASSQQKRSGPRAPASRPQAILLNPGKKDVADNVSEVGGEEEATDNVVKSLAGVQIDADEEPITFRLAARLCFSMLDEVLRRPARPSISGTVEVVAPYITISLTFLGQLGQRPAALDRVERFVPWPRLVNLFNKIPREVEVRADQHGMRLAGAALPEDWCMRGMEWAGRTMFARGYFKPKGNRTKIRNDIQSIAESEMDALALGAEAEDGGYTSDGVIEPDGDNDPDVLMANLATARWRRIALIAGWAAAPKGVSGLAFDPSVPKFAVLSSLRTKISRWKEEAKAEEEAQKAMLRKRAASVVGDLEDVGMLESEDEDDGDDQEDSEAVRGLKTRRRELRAIIKAARSPPTVKKAQTVPRSQAAVRPAKPSLDVVPGYTVLVFDTNILVGMLSIVKDLLEARRWTLVIPLAVVTELDGLKVNPPPLGKDAADALRFLETSIRDPATRSQSKYLKIQTSRGNYLHDLSIRSEEIDFTGNVSTSNARNMDDLVLRAAIWQDEHFSNRLAIVNPSVDRAKITATTAKVALITFDRNLRLKAHARGIAAAHEKDIARFLAFRDQG